jgi:shikimate dehydrogenase
VRFQVSPANLEGAVAGVSAMNRAGFNCSLPHNVAVIWRLDDLGASAEITEQRAA